MHLGVATARQLCTVAAPLVLAFCSTDASTTTFPLVGECVRAARWQRPVKEGAIIASAIVGPPRFSISVAAEGAHTVVALHGELDIAAVECLEHELADLRQAGLDDLVLDLRDLRFMDATGLQLLLGLRQGADVARLPVALVAGPPSVQRVFTLTATHTLFQWRPALVAPRRARLQRLPVRTDEESARLKDAELRHRALRAAD